LSQEDSLATTVNMAAYSDALIVLGTASILTPTLRRIGVSPILGYLAAGMVLGPLGLGSLAQGIPPLKWVTISEPKTIDAIAELGIVFLLFLIGLEMTFERLNSLRRAIFVLGGSQWLVTTALIGVVAYSQGQPAAAAIVIGACLALSSTAIVIDLLAEQNRLGTGVGRTSFAVLLAQDLAIVPLLIFIATLAAGTQTGLLQTLNVAIIQALLALVLIVLIGRVFLRPLFRLVASAHSAEIFMAAVLFVIVGTGVIAALAGLSMALGAFVAGLLLAETEYRKNIEAIVNPFKGLLLGVFFFTVGMLIDVRLLVAQPVAMLAAIVGLLFLKATVLLVLVRATGTRWPVAVETALLLAPGGELAFVGIGAAKLGSVIAPPVADFLLVTVALSMALTPLLALVAQRLGRKLRVSGPVDPELSVRPSRQSRHAIVVGYGRVGRVVCALLDHHKVPFIATDFDGRTVSTDRKQGHQVFYGDATDAAFLELCNINDAAAVIITIHTPSAIERLVATIRAVRPDIPIISRARDAEHARKLYRLGVNDAVPETIEASLQLSEAALVGIGVPTGYVIASIHEKRDVFRAELQAAAKDAGIDETHAMRPKAAE
jgi:CPA2 family monovalent cation:H+ antiporter-2